MNNKKATTTLPINDLLADRWSPRAFDVDKEIEKNKVTSLLEAARWAPSCFNEQPWRFIVFNKHSNEFSWKKAVSCLAEKNQLWASHAPLLILSCADELFGHNGNANRWAQYDTGAASVSICLQATALGLHTHQMGGFDTEQTKKLFKLPDHIAPMAMIAVGYMGNTENLAEDFVEAESAARERKPLDSIMFENEWS